MIVLTLIFVWSNLKQEDNLLMSSVVRCLHKFNQHLVKNVLGSDYGILNKGYNTALTIVNVIKFTLNSV